MKILILFVQLFYLCIIFTALGCSRDNSSEPPSRTLPDLSWQQTTLDSGVVNTIASNLNGLVFADNGAGLYYTADQGETWNISTTNYNIANMTFIPNGDIYAFTTCLPSGTIIRSRDNGYSWISLSSPMVCPNSMVFISPDTLIIGDHGGELELIGSVYVSEDAFSTLKQVNFPDSTGIFCLSTNSNNDIFAGTTKGVYRSSDTGETWLQLNEGLMDPEKLPWQNYIQFMLINPNNDHIYIATYSTIFRSIDNGKNWTTTGFENIKYITSIIINDCGVLFTGVYRSGPEQGVYYSLDDGATWAKISDESFIQNIQSLTIDLQGYLYVGTSEGVYRTNVSTTNE